MLFGKLAHYPSHSKIQTPKRERGDGREWSLRKGAFEVSCPNETCDIREMADTWQNKAAFEPASGLANAHFTPHLPKSEMKDAPGSLPDPIASAIST